MNDPPDLAAEVETLAARLDDLLRYALRRAWYVPAGWPTYPGRTALALTRTYRRLVELGIGAVRPSEDALARLGWSSLPAALRTEMSATTPGPYAARTSRLPSRPRLYGLASSEYVIRWYLERLHFLRHEEGLDEWPRALLLSVPFEQLAKAVVPQSLAPLLEIERSLSTEERGTLLWYLRERYRNHLSQVLPAAAADDEVLAALARMNGESPGIDEGRREPRVYPLPEPLRGSRELSLLDLAEESGGRWDTAGVGEHLARLDASLAPGSDATLAALGSRGLAVAVPRNDARQGWILTLEGHEVLTDCRRYAWPLGPGELESFLSDLHGKESGPSVAPETRFRSTSQRAKALQQVALLAPGSDVGREVWRMVDDADPAVRLALFEALAPPRPDPDGGNDDWAAQGQGGMCLPAYAWDAILRAGLRDATPRVREAAAALTYATARGASLVGELLAQLTAAEPGLCRWSALALGSAADAESRAALEKLLTGNDPELAAAAVRALAARPDGRDAWRRSLTDDRPTVSWAARLALEQVVEGLSAEELDRLAAQGGDLKMGVEVYRSRIARRAEAAERPRRRSVWKEILR